MRSTIYHTRTKVSTSLSLSVCLSYNVYIYIMKTSMHMHRRMLIIDEFQCARSTKHDNDGCTPGWQPHAWSPLLLPHGQAYAFQHYRQKWAQTLKITCDERRCLYIPTAFYFSPGVLFRLTTWDCFFKDCTMQPAFPTLVINHVPSFQALNLCASGPPPAETVLRLAATTWCV